MRRPEEAAHKAIAAFLRVALTPPWLFFHPANGGARSKAEAGALKAMGVYAGMPDLIVIGPAPEHKPYFPRPRVIALEVKAPKPFKSSLSPAQRDAIAALADCGIPTIVVHSVDEAEHALRELGVPLKGLCR